MFWFLSTSLSGFKTTKLPEPRFRAVLSEEVPELDPELDPEPERALV